MYVHVCKCIYMQEDIVYNVNTVGLHLISLMYHEQCQGCY